MTATSIKRKAATLGHYRKNIQAAHERLSEAFRRHTQDLPVADPTALGAILDGVRWYARAAEDIQRCLTHSPYPRDSVRSHVCWCVATLSPGIRWERNIHEAQMVFHEVYPTLIREPDFETFGNNFTAYSTNVEKCREYLRGTSTEAPSGNKVRAFYYALRCACGYSENLQGYGTLVIDRWMLRLASNNPKVKLSARTFDCAWQAVKESYEANYEEIQTWSPDGNLVRLHDYQAILWLLIRED